MRQPTTTTHDLAAASSQRGPTPDLSRAEAIDYYAFEDGVQRIDDANNYKDGSG